MALATCWCQIEYPVLSTLPVRTRLTLLYLAVISGALLLFSVVSFTALRYALVQLKLNTLNAREDRMLAFLERNKSTQVPLVEQLRNYATIAHEGNLVQIRSLNGTVIFPISGADVNWLPTIHGDCTRPIIEDIQLAGGSAAVMCHRILLDGHPELLYVGGSLEEQNYILVTYRRGLLMLLPCLLIVAGLGGHFLSRRALRPVDLMTKAAIGMGIGNLSSRLPLPKAQDELWALADAWNQLLDRLESSVSRLSEFSADASHDLRTSITVILATAQLSLRGHRTTAEYRDDLERIVGECRTASTLLDALLSLARSHNFLYEVEFEKINVNELVLAGCRRVEGLAESSGIILDWRLPSDELFVDGDELLLQRLLGILLDNAIKYTPEGGEILVEVGVSGSGAMLSVRDTGIGMSEDVRHRIFDRFYQADLRERKASAGSGLGLSIARWIAEAHRAQLSVESEPMQGSVFEVYFSQATSQVNLVWQDRAQRATSPR
jgi:two-component system heavy metal sensor histidine kinase CusS